MVAYYITATRRDKYKLQDLPPQEFYPSLVDLSCEVGVVWECPIGLLHHYLGERPEEWEGKEYWEG